KVPDGLPERLPLLRVRERVLEAGPADPHRLRGDPDAPAVEGGEGDLEPLAHLAEPLVVPNPDVPEHELGRVRALDPELLLDAPHRQTVGRLVDDERDDAPVPRAW